MGDAGGAAQHWYENQRLRDAAGVALTTVLVSFGAAFATGLFDYSATMQKDEFQRLERLTDRLESRLDYYAQRNADLYRERQQLRADMDSLGYVVAQLQWRNYQLNRQVEALERQIKALGKIPVLPPELLDLLYRWTIPNTPKSWIPFPHASRFWRAVYLRSHRADETPETSRKIQDRLGPPRVRTGRRRRAGRFTPGGLCLSR